MEAGQSGAGQWFPSRASSATGAGLADPDACLTFTVLTAGSPDSLFDPSCHSSTGPNLSVRTPIIYGEEASLLRADNQVDCRLSVPKAIVRVLEPIHGVVTLAHGSQGTHRLSSRGSRSGHGPPQILPLLHRVFAPKLLPTRVPPAITEPLQHGSACAAGFSLWSLSSPLLRKDLKLFWRVESSLPVSWVRRSRLLGWSRSPRERDGQTFGWFRQNLFEHHRPTLSRIATIPRSYQRQPTRMCQVDQHPRANKVDSNRTNSP